MKRVFQSTEDGDAALIVGDRVWIRL